MSEAVFPSGVANIPTQVHYLASKRPLSLNVLLFGEAALGKTLAINAILGQSVFAQTKTKTFSEERTGQHLRLRRAELEEHGINVGLSIIDVPELGQSVRKRDVKDEVVQYVKDQHLTHLKLESSLADRYLPLNDASKKQGIKDKRVHVCLYFINPSNHKLSQTDLELLEGFSALTNVILVIAKADMLLRHELTRLKYNIKEQLKDKSNRIKLFCSADQAMPEPFVSLNADENSAKGQLSTGRSYPWGFVRRTHSNLKLSAAATNRTNQGSINELPRVLFRSYLPHLLLKTEEYYEAVRSQYLLANTDKDETGKERLVKVQQQLAQLTLV